MVCIMSPLRARSKSFLRGRPVPVSWLERSLYACTDGHKPV